MTTFFDGPQHIRAWLKKNHTKASELKVGFRKGRHAAACLQWDDAVDEAICFGWLPGTRKSIDSATEYCTLRPCKQGEKWPSHEAARAEALLNDPRMTKWGREAYLGRKIVKSAKEADADVEVRLPTNMIAELKRHNGAWTTFQRMPLSHRQKWTLWVVGAKHEETRANRFAKLLADLSKPR